MVWKMIAIDTVPCQDSSLCLWEISTKFNEDCYKETGLEDCEQFRA